MSIKERLKQLSQNKIVSVEIDGERYFLRELKAKHITQARVEITKYLVFCALVEENGDPVFSSIAEVDELPLNLTTKLAKEVQNLNALTDEAYEDVKKN